MRASAESPRFDSIAELFEALEAPLLGYAHRLLNDADMAQDIVQEAFLRLQRDYPKVNAPRAWLYRTVHNLVCNHQRRAHKIVPLDPPAKDPETPALEIADPQPPPDEQIARVEGVGLVRLGLQNLPPRSRELIRLRFNEGLSYKDISTRTGLTVGHVGYLLHHALKGLAADLARSGIIP